MGVLTYFWVKVERLRWVLYAWIVLMLAGVAITDYGIFCGSTTILIHLCDLWLGLSAVGYFCTGIGLRFACLYYGGIVSYFRYSYFTFVRRLAVFLATGLVMTANLLMFAETQWDMRLPIDNYGVC